MDLREAIKLRHSIRKYHLRPLQKDAQRILLEEVKRCNDEGGLHIQLVQDEPLAFKSWLCYGTFLNVTSYLVMAGRKSPTLDERIGYYGERLVLLAQTLGIDSCWAGLSYQKVKGAFTLEKDEHLGCLIALGYGNQQGRKHKIKTPSQVSNLKDGMPSWFREGVEAALLSPTAVNQQKFFFELTQGTDPNGRPVVKAKPGFSLIGYTHMDLGIARLHFELGAGKEHFSWKNPWHQD